MARTKQTAYGRPQGRDLTKEQKSPTLPDHEGKPYTVEGGVIHNLNDDLVIQKLSIHLYTLSDCKPSLADIAQRLFKTGCFSEIWSRTDRGPRIDVYPSPMESIEACIEHHRREKIHRRQAIDVMRRRVANAVPVTSDDEPDEIEEKRDDAVRRLRGKEPLPHIVPAWCVAAAKQVMLGYMPYLEQRYKSFILVVPKDCESFEDVSNKGIWFVRFDLDVSPEMDFDFWNQDPDEDQLVDSRAGWVWVDKFPDGHRGPPVDVKRGCIHGIDRTRQMANWRLSESELLVTKGCEVCLGTIIVSMMSVFSDESYRSQLCEACCDGTRNHECEWEMDEHYNDENGECAAYTIHAPPIRRSRRLARRSRVIE